MSARVWTREELDRVHPLQSGWTWDQDRAGWTALDSAGSAVWVDSHGRVRIESPRSTKWAAEGVEEGIAPKSVTLAVILVNMGRDPIEATGPEVTIKAEDADRLAWSLTRARDLQHGAEAKAAIVIAERDSIGRRWADRAALALTSLDDVDEVGPTLMLGHSGIVAALRAHDGEIDWRAVDQDSQIERLRARAEAAEDALAEVTGRAKVAL
jgi:hypothetical protein